MRHTLGNGRYSILLAFLIAFAIAELIGSSSFAQGIAGGFGPGMTSIQTTPMKIVIMLGPDFDFASKPFTDAPTIRSEITHPEIQGYFPSFESIEIDVKTPLPKGEEIDIAVIATHPPESTEAEIAKIKRTVQLIALRFSINHVEMISSDDELADEATAIWLRLPYIYETGDEFPKGSSNIINRYAVVAKSIAELYESNAPSTRARIDVYQGQGSRHPNDSSAGFDPFVATPYPASGSNPFGEPTTNEPNAETSDDPFAAPANSRVVIDPFGGPIMIDPAPANSDDPFAAPPQATQRQATQRQATQPPQAKQQGQSDESISSSIASLRQVRAQVQSVIQQMSDGKTNRNTPEAFKAIAQDLQLESELQTLQIQQLENKVEQLRRSLEQRSQPTEQRAIIQARYEKLFGKLPSSLNVEQLFQ